MLETFRPYVILRLMESFLIDQLTDGDLRTIGVADSVVKVAMNQPELIPEIVAALEFAIRGTDVDKGKPRLTWNVSWSSGTKSFTTLIVMDCC